MVDPGEEQTHGRDKMSCCHVGLSPGKMETKFPGDIILPESNGRKSLMSAALF